MSESPWFMDVVGMDDYNRAIEQREDGDEWGDDFGFRFRRVGDEIEMFVGGKWVPYLWWLG